MALLKGLVLICLFALASCGFLTPKKEDGPDAGFERRRVEEYFVSSGIEKYFLPEIPIWANFSEEARCRRDVSIKFFDIGALNSSLQLNYEEAIQLQLMFNSKVQALQDQIHVSHISLKDEEDVFYEVSEQIQAGVRVFRAPHFKKVHLIWIDPFLENPELLHQKMNLPSVQLGHPIFLSLCLTDRSMASWMRINQFTNQNIRRISYELITPFNEAGKMDTSYHMNLKQLLPEKKITLFVKQGWNTPQIFTGKFNTKKF